LIALAVSAALAVAAPSAARAADGEAPLPAAAAPAERPLARFAFTRPEGDDLQRLMARVVESAGAVDPFDPEDDERVLRRLRDSAIDVLATEGYFTPTISAEADPEGRARYVLLVDAGPRTLVAAVDIALTGPIEQQPERMRELAAGWELPVGKPFRDPAWSTAKARLLARVQERDFPAARLVESSADIDADEGAARLRIGIDSGPAFTLGELEIVQEEGKGLKRYDRELVDRFNEIRPGDRYDAGRLLELQRRLQSAPYFSSVLVDVPIDPARPDGVPIRLTLVEAKSKRISTGVGFSTNTGFQVEALYRQVGVFGFPYTLQAGAGYDKTRSVGYADILLPPKPNGARDSFGILAEHTDIQNEITDRYAAGVERLYTREGAPGLGGNLFESRTSIKLQRETTEESGKPESRFTNDTLTLANTWTWRRVDSITNPRRGDVITLVGAVGASRTGLSELLAESFVYGYARYVRYFPLFERHQLILRGEIGHVVTDDLRFVPTDYRFRTGGSGSVRGYQYQSLGIQEDGTVTGADALIVGSAEYVHWFTPTWGGAVFYDVGDADNDLERVRLARGYGTGVRYRTIAGPLALDVAYGERDREWRLHFSIAVAF
jgi:translocation and assembly module TamA